MSKDIIFDFCIIPNPFASGGRSMIFITKSGEGFLEKEIAEEKDYKDIKEILEQFGYTETSPLQFESSNNTKTSEPTILDMRGFLEEFGLSYSRELEVNVVSDLNNLKSETDKLAKDFNNPHENPIGEKTKNKLIASKKEIFDFKHTEPKDGEIVPLYFYLFLEFGLNHSGKPIIHFNADFQSSEDHNDRNYIRILESDFERVVDPKKPNMITLVSKKTQSDLLKEAGILYSGHFKYKRQLEKDGSIIIKESTYKYKLAEVKQYLNPEQCILIDTSRMGYDKLINLSNKIRVESITEYKKFIPTGEIEHEAEELSKFLSKKMEILSEKEEFEEASLIMKDVKFIQDKVDLIKTLDKTEITTEEYFKIFSIS